MDLSIRLSDPHRTRLSGEVAVSWEDSSEGRTWKIQVGLRRHEAQYADISGQGATEYQVSPALLGEDLAGLTQKNAPGLADNPQVGNVISHATADDTQFSHGTPPSSQISEDESITVVDFWNSLSPEEKQAFRSLAAKRVFATGARLMHEGEQANHVAVILDGWTEIRVRQGGGERVVARRGPGQLIGERAALQISVRSATVVAIQPVDALVMHTEDFVAFVSDHPGVLSIVENQIFTRLREGPPAQDPQPDGAPGILEDRQAAAPSPSGGRSRIEPAVPHARPPNGENCTVLLTDVVAFGADRRNEEDRRIIRRRIFKMTRSALKPMWEFLSLRGPRGWPADRRAIEHSHGTGSRAAPNRPARRAETAQSNLRRPHPSAAPGGGNSRSRHKRHRRRVRQSDNPGGPDARRGTLQAGHDGG